MSCAPHAGAVFVSAVIENSQRCLSIHLCCPETFPTREARFMRPAIETLQVQLQKIGSRLTPKPAKAKKQKDQVVPATTPAAPVLRLLDSAGEELLLTSESATQWPLASALSVAFENGSKCDVSLPVHWNPPFADALRVAEAPVFGVPVLAEASLRNCTAEDCQWTWQRSRETSSSAAPTVDSEWEVVSTARLYVPSISDEERFLRFSCQLPFPGTSVCSAPSKRRVSSPPADTFRWTLLPTLPCTPAFRVATYNVLADAYSGTPEAYCSPSVLFAPRRRQLILRDLLHIDADVIGLQEVDSGQLHALAPLSVLGWDSVFTRKSGAAADGCALFWRRSRFELVGEPFEFRLGGNIEDLCGVDAQALAAYQTCQSIRLVLNKVGTVAQGVVLRDVQVEGKLIIVANTHLFYHPDANHIRLIQLHMLISDLARRAAAFEQDDGSTVAVMVLGDLNARKGNFGTSDIGKPPQAAYRLVRDGKILSDDVDWLGSSWCPTEWQQQQQQENHNEGPTAPCCNDADQENNSRSFGLDLELSIPLMDANPHIQVTNFTDTFQECLDYILLDARALHSTITIEAPDVSYLRLETALPSTTFPSDHIPVISDVAYGTAR